MSVENTERVMHTTASRWSAGIMKQERAFYVSGRRHSARRWTPPHHGDTRVG